MISPYELAWFIAIGLIINHWWQSRHVKTLAFQAARRHCREHGVQLLDQSVALERIRPHRNEFGQLCWRRRYGFEFSSTGAERHHGAVITSGNRVMLVDMGDHVTWEARNL